ncbi:hypothetical protein GCM10023149_19510 [Mucilaginibacter gynuensis]|uniref:YD repeat-containing protein n=2 Tax=Mucilaginibacter gynuensis TaxID=1302236 RepID=A0ABP8G9Y4_9SPHI
MPTPSIWPEKSFKLAIFFICGLLITLCGCGKPSDNPTPPTVENPTGCVIASDIDQALGIRNFEYDDKGLLIKMKGPNYYYGPFVRTITATKAVDTYPSSSVDGNGNHYYGNIDITYNYSGGSGNIYDGNPEFLHQLFTSSISGTALRTDSMFQFKYDAKKHLTNVLIPRGGGTPDADGFIFFRYELQFTYDVNENVTQVKIVYDFSRKVTVLPSGESRFDYIQKSDELLNITYDNKISPYVAISKYWKFIGADFNGFGAYNLDKVRFWAGRCAILSKNNPVKITGKLITTASTVVANVDATLTYEYNDKGLPVSMAINGVGTNAFTYNCK